MSVRRIFSGIQPTGIPHLGNYLGAIKHWVNLQTKFTNNLQKDCVMFCIVDLHSCTTCHDAFTMKNNILNMVASLLACGIDPKKSLIFQQSQVPYHTDLTWFLSCLTPTGQLKRMHQWKVPPMRLLSFDVRNSDAKSEKSTHVPVGDDQLQHIELTRDICESFNKKYGETFSAPNAVLTPASRIMSLKNPLEKMSKSSQNANSRLDLTDTCDVLSEKLRKAVTDSEPYISEDLTERPGVRNLVNIYSALGDMAVPEVIAKYHGVQFFTRDLKKDITELLMSTLEPIRAEFGRLTNDKSYLENILRTGSNEANIVAKTTMDEVYRKVGLR